MSRYVPTAFHLPLCKLIHIQCDLKGDHYLFEGKDSDELPLFIKSLNPLIGTNEFGNIESGPDLATSPHLPYTPSLSNAETLPPSSPVEHHRLNPSANLCPKCHRKCIAAACDRKLCRSDCISMGGCSYRDHPRSTPSSSIPTTTHIAPSRSQCTRPVDFESASNEPPLSPEDFLIPVQSTQPSSTPDIVISQAVTTLSNSQPSLATPFESAAHFTHFTSLDLPYDADGRGGKPLWKP
jgi:hypothetical protein